MKFSTITISALSIIASATQANARRRHLNIKGEESDASMSYMLSPARGSSKSKSATGAPTGSPTGSPTSAPIPEPGECNSVITTGNDNGNVFTLQKSLQCDCPGVDFTSGLPDPLSTIKPALTIDGQGIVLNLNGYTVECETGAGIVSDVIKVLGKANTVMGPGTLKGGGGGAAGINLSSFGGGFHTIDGVNIGPNTVEGIKIQSNDNTLINNFITETRTDGVAILGNARNIIKGNTIVNTGRGIGLDVGINLSQRSISTSDDNLILENTIISSKGAGITVIGKRVVIQGNTINQSGGNGIQVISLTSEDVISEDVISEDVIIKDNSITNSGEFGIAILAGTLDTVVIGNTLAGNTNGTIDNQGTGSVFAGNVPPLM